MSRRSNKYIVVSLFFLALALRIFLIPNRGFEADVAFWKSWGLSALDNGVVEGIAITNNNYPTPFSYLLAILAFCYRLFADPHIFNDFWNDGNVLFLLIAKLPSIIADLGIAGIILWIGWKGTSMGDTSERSYKRPESRNCNDNPTHFPPLPFSFFMLCAIFYLFNPIVLIDGALWGQVDSLGVFVFLIAIILAASEKPLLAGAVFTLSMMTKLQNMIYGPLFFLLLWQLGSFKGLMKGFLGAALSFVILNGEFFLKKNANAVFDSLTSNYDYFPLMSLNAFNLWWIVAKGEGMKMTDKLLTIGIINAKTTGLLLFSTGYLLAAFTMVKGTISDMWKKFPFEGKNRNKSESMGDTCEGSCKRPESRNCNEYPEKTTSGMSVVSRLTRNGNGLRDEDLCGTRAWPASTQRGEQDPYRSDILFHFFTALIIVCFSFFLFQTESHDRYAFPISVFYLLWGAFYIYRSNTEKNRILWWTTISFRIFIIGYIVFSTLFFLNLHTALAYNYPNNSLSFLLFLRAPMFTIPIAIFQIAFFFFFLFLVRKTIGILTMSFCLIVFLSSCLFLNLPLFTKSPVSLTTFTPHISQQGYGMRMTNMPVNTSNASKNWNRLSVQYSFYQKGIGTHASSYIVYDMNGLFKRFTSDIGIDTQAGGKGTVVFKVYGDDRLLFQSDLMKRYEYPRRIDIDITGVKKFALIVDDGGDGNSDDHADWLNPQLWP
jgi:hypothetical protein